jgi:hypothetical protein
LTSILLFALAGCPKPAPPVATPVAGSDAPPVEIPPPAPAHPLDRAEQGAVQKLLPRDPEPVCADVEAGLAQPALTLLRIAEETASPPWVPMRAAGCAVEHADDPAVEAALIRWVTDDDLAGLGLLAVNLLDRMPEAVAMRVASAALDGPIADRARDEIAGSARQSVRELLPP